VKKINEIKDGRGLRKFFKEALNAGKSTCDLLGGIEISLRVSLCLLKKNSDF